MVVSQNLYFWWTRSDQQCRACAPWFGVSAVVEGRDWWHHLVRDAALPHSWCTFLHGHRKWIFWWIKSDRCLTLVPFSLDQIIFRWESNLAGGWTNLDHIPRKVMDGFEWLIIWVIDYMPAWFKQWLTVSGQLQKSASSSKCSKCLIVARAIWRKPLFLLGLHAPVLVL